MKVVSHTSPLHYLILIGEIRVLPALFGRLLVPIEVISELAHPRSPDPVREWAGNLPSRIDVIDGTTALSDPKLGPGESAAIAVALEHSTNLLLIDERYGTKVARDLGIESVGTVGVLAAAAGRVLVSLRESYAALRATSFRGPEELMAELVRIDEQRRR